jgi:hypothetical protein
MTSLEQPKKASQEARREAARKWRQDHREAYNAYMRKWSMEHREKCNEYMCKWRESNPDKSRECQYRYRLRHDVKLKLRIEELLEEEVKS